MDLSKSRIGDYKEKFPRYLQDMTLAVNEDNPEVAHIFFCDHEDGSIYGVQCIKCAFSEVGFLLFFAERVKALFGG
ncbi:MAG: hypothetical protein ABEJ72_10440 [Candidatus Aenigmatarchaeota archaeon]